mmetsp:Transcript_58792/g.104865  ORF Transcript_58792/g.104865 Transcript_58792/m.104865 type:complete len:346 (+) Transcript_58792:307-1344(+)
MELGTALLSRTELLAYINPKSSFPVAQIKHNRARFPFGPTSTWRTKGVKKINTDHAAHSQVQERRKPSQPTSTGASSGSPTNCTGPALPKAIASSLGDRLNPPWLGSSTDHNGKSVSMAKCVPPMMEYRTIVMSAARVWSTFRSSEAAVLGTSTIISNDLRAAPKLLSDEGDRWSTGFSEAFRNWRDSPGWDSGRKRRPMTNEATASAKTIEMHKRYGNCTINGVLSSSHLSAGLARTASTGPSTCATENGMTRRAMPLATVAVLHTSVTYVLATEELAPRNPCRIRNVMAHWNDGANGKRNRQSFGRNSPVSSTGLRPQRSEIMPHMGPAIMAPKNGQLLRYPA